MTVWRARKYRIRTHVLSIAFASMAPPAHADLTTLVVLFDIDRMSTSGCTIGTAEGDAQGIEMRLRTQIDLVTFEVANVSYANCLATGGNTFEAERPLSRSPTPPWIVAVGEGTSLFSLSWIHRQRLSGCDSTLCSSPPSAFRGNQWIPAPDTHANRNRRQTRAPSGSWSR